MKITVIGAGPGGYTAAFDAAKRGAEVTLIEAKQLGGTCLNCGCIPTKTLKSSAEAIENIHRATEFGISGSLSPEIDMAAVMARKRKVTETLIGGLEKTCEKLKVHVIKGKGCIINAGLVKVTEADGSIRNVEGDKIIIATGSNVLNLPSLPVDGKYVLSSNEALELSYIPKRLLIVGGGVVGMELGFIFNSFGSDVTVVEGQNRILPLPSVEEEMSKLLQREAKKKKIRIELCRTVNSLKIEGDTVFADLAPSPFLSSELIPDSAKKPVTLEADVIFSTIGRVPVTEGLGLADAGIKTDKRGYIEVNDFLETSLPGVYAIGDILGPMHIMLAHVASAEAHIAVANIFGSEIKSDYSVVPSGIFASPEIGDVGMTVNQAKAAGYDVAVSEFVFRELGKAQAMGELPGKFLLIYEKTSRKLLGAHIAGAHATDLIAESALALKMNCTIDDIAHTIHAHPTLAEGVMEAASV